MASGAHTAMKEPFRAKAEGGAAAGEPLNPVDEELFHRYLLHGDPLTCTLVARLGRRLEPARLERALRLVMARHPLLRARVDVDLGAARRYVWREIPGAEPPLAWALLGAGDEEELLAEVERRQHNHRMELDRTLPFRLFATELERDRTHLQLAFSHVAMDALSAFAVFGQLFRAYLELERGGAPAAEPLPWIKGDWGELFGFELDAEARRRVQGVVAADLGARGEGGPPAGGSWPRVTAALSARRAGLEERALLEPFPRLDRSRALLTSRTRSEDVAFLRFHTSAEERARLEALARRAGPQCTVHDAVTACYVLAQLELAREAGEAVERVGIGISLTIRPLFRDPRVADAVGNLYLPERFFIDLERGASPSDEELIAALADRKRRAVMRQPRACLERLLLRQAVAEPVPAEDWLAFQAAVASVGAPNSLRIGDLGSADRALAGLEGLALETLELGASCAGFPVPSISTYTFGGRFSVGCTYVPAAVDPDQAQRVWRRFREEVARRAAG